MIIENDKQCQNTKEWIGRFKEAIAYLDANPPADGDAWYHKLLRDSYAGEVETLRRQVTAYETGIPEPPRVLTPEQLEMVARVRKEFEERFGRWELEDATHVNP